MKIAFKIPPHTEDFSRLHLVAEAGSDEVSFLIFAKEPFTAHGFYTFNFDKNLNLTEQSEKIKTIIESEDVLSKQFASVNIFYNYRDVTLIPDEYFVYGQNDAVCNLMFGEDNRTISFHENVKGLPVKTIYRAPQNINEMLRNHFAGSNFKHAVSCISYGAGDLIDCTVYHSTIKTAVRKQGNLQGILYFDYTSPADVVFYLLNICKQYELAPDTTGLQLSGMIAESSVLYEDIRKYFLNMSFSILPADVLLAEKLTEHPHHFYSHLTALAQCV